MKKEINCKIYKVFIKNYRVYTSVKGSGSKASITIGNEGANEDVKRYFWYQENGTRVMSAKKFMKNGFYDNVSKADKAIQEVVRNELGGK